jgi:hypothetical protein
MQPAGQYPHARRVISIRPSACLPACNRRQQDLVDEISILQTPTTCTVCIVPYSTRQDRTAQPSPRRKTRPDLPMHAPSCTLAEARARFCDAPFGNGKVRGAGDRCCGTGVHQAKRVG